MSYYEQNIPPTREQRLTIGDSFCGKSEDLLDCARSGCLLEVLANGFLSNALIFDDGLNSGKLRNHYAWPARVW